MKDYLLTVLLILFSSNAFGKSVDHTGLLTEYHNLEPAGGAPVVQLFLSKVSGFFIEATGDGNSTGELHHINVSLSGFGEYNHMSAQGAGDITNDSGPVQGRCTGTYTTIQQGNTVYVRSWTNRADGRSNGGTWINAVRDAVITLNISAKELDCAFCNTCSRGGSWSQTIQMTLPELPAIVPSGCDGPDALLYELEIVDGQPTFSGFRNITVESNSDDLRIRPAPAVPPVSGVDPIMPTICIFAP